MKFLFFLIVLFLMLYGINAAGRISARNAFCRFASKLAFVSLVVVTLFFILFDPAPLRLGVSYQRSTITRIWVIASPFADSFRMETGEMESGKLYYRDMHNRRYWCSLPTHVDGELTIALNPQDAITVGWFYAIVRCGRARLFGCYWFNSHEFTGCQRVSSRRCRCVVLWARRPVCMAMVRKLA